jgi:hypothetical protein
MVRPDILRVVPPAAALPKRAAVARRSGTKSITPQRPPRRFAVALRAREDAGVGDRELNDRKQKRFYQGEP